LTAKKNIENFMMTYLILGICLVNTILIGVILLKQKELNLKLLNSLESKEEDIELNSLENKKHIDDMLKMREMYESD
tara:strand:- start:608 stop:838 length:231 start_codon:yes stop_codon:yes gene_type:complete